MQSTPARGAGSALKKIVTLVSFLALTLLIGCRSTHSLQDRGGYLLDTQFQAQAQESRVRFLVMHYTAEDFPSSLQVLTGDRVSVHYLIPARPPVRNGKPVALQLVPESDMAWHAGASFWRGVSRLNGTSVGIELENPGYHRTLLGTRWTPYPEQQIALLKALARQIIERYRIPPQNVVGHSDIAPQRKLDPGPLFPWERLARADIGAWPDEERVAFHLRGRDGAAATEASRLLDKLARYGYPAEAGMTPAQQRRVIAAFQMHFRPRDYRGRADAETEAIADALLEKYGAATP